MHLLAHASALALLVCILNGCASTHSHNSNAEPTAMTTHPTTSPATPATTPPATPATPAVSSPRLGNFSVSLTVKDLAASLAFYEKLGFRVVFGDQKRMAIMQNDTATIGLFQGMFAKNTLTFNPGWDRGMATLGQFDDVRGIQRTLTSRGLTLATTADESSTGPAGFMLMDPDGNPILIDQHVPRGK